MHGPTNLKTYPYLHSTVSLCNGVKNSVGPESEALATLFVWLQSAVSNFFPPIQQTVCIFVLCLHTVTVFQLVRLTCRVCCNIPSIFKYFLYKSLNSKVFTFELAVSLRNVCLSKCMYVSVCLCVSVCVGHYTVQREQAE